MKPEKAFPRAPATSARLASERVACCLVRPRSDSKNPTPKWRKGWRNMTAKAWARMMKSNVRLGSGRGRGAPGGRRSADRGGLVGRLGIDQQPDQDGDEKAGSPGEEEGPV